MPQTTQNTSTPQPINGWQFDNPPTLTPFNFERIDINYWNNFVSCYWHYSCYIGMLYIVIIFTLTRYMENRQAFELKYPLFLWNACLGVFSIVGFARVSPPLFLLLLRENGFYNSVCVKKGLNLPNVLWGLLFAVSKIWELGDTIFIILRKRRLVFLQWYHHLTTLLVTWAVAPLMEPIGRWYGSLNFGVHGVMYTYFALKTVGVSIPGFVKRSITMLQFTQMIVGLGVNLASFYYEHTGYNCARDRTSILAFTFVYGSFTIAFANLIFHRRDVNKQSCKKNE